MGIENVRLGRQSLGVVIVIAIQASTASAQSAIAAASGGDAENHLSLRTGRDPVRRASIHGWRLVTSVQGPRG
jgi:hypothetical protein